MIFLGGGDFGGGFVQGLEQARKANWDDRLNAERLKQQYVTTNTQQGVQDSNIYKQNQLNLAAGNQSSRTDQLAGINWQGDMNNARTVNDAIRAQRQYVVDNSLADQRGQVMGQAYGNDTLQQQAANDRMMNGGAAQIGTALAGQAIFQAQQGEQQARGGFFTDQARANAAGSFNNPDPMIAQDLSVPHANTAANAATLTQSHQYSGALAPDKHYEIMQNPTTGEQMYAVINNDGSGAPIPAVEYHNQRMAARQGYNYAMTSGLAPTFGGGTVRTGNEGGGRGNKNSSNGSAASDPAGISAGISPLPTAAQYQQQQAAPAVPGQPVAPAGPMRAFGQGWTFRDREGAPVQLANNGHPQGLFAGAQVPGGVPAGSQGTLGFIAPPVAGVSGQYQGLGTTILPGGTPDAAGQEFQQEAQAYAQRWGMPMPPAAQQQLQQQLQQKHAQIADFNQRSAAAKKAAEWAAKIGPNPPLRDVVALIQHLGGQAKAYRALSDAGRDDIVQAHTYIALADQPIWGPN